MSEVFKCFVNHHHVVITKYFCRALVLLMLLTVRKVTTCASSCWILFTWVITHLSYWLVNTVCWVYHSIKSLYFLLVLTGLSNLYHSSSNLHIANIIRMFRYIFQDASELVGIQFISIVYLWQHGLRLLLWLNCAERRFTWCHHVVVVVLDWFEWV